MVSINYFSPCIITYCNPQIIVYCYCCCCFFFYVTSFRSVSRIVRPRKSSTRPRRITIMTIIIARAQFRRLPRTPKTFRLVFSCFFFTPRPRRAPSSSDPVGKPFAFPQRHFLSGREETFGRNYRTRLKGKKTEQKISPVTSLIHFLKYIVHVYLSIPNARTYV